MHKTSGCGCWAIYQGAPPQLSKLNLLDCSIYVQYTGTYCTFMYSIQVHTVHICTVYTYILYIYVQYTGTYCTYMYSIQAHTICTVCTCILYIYVQYTGTYCTYMYRHIQYMYVQYTGTYCTGVSVQVGQIKSSPTKLLDENPLWGFDACVYSL